MASFTTVSTNLGNGRKAVAMVFTYPELAVSILFQAMTGRPIVLSKFIGDAWLLQCNGVHFIQDPTNKQEVAVVECTVNELEQVGFLRAEAWQGANRPIYLTEAGFRFCKKVKEDLQDQPTSKGEDGPDSFS